MSFANAGTTYIVNPSNQSGAFIQQQHVNHQINVPQQNVQRIIATNCMPNQQQQHCTIQSQHQIPNLQQQCHVVSIPVTSTHIEKVGTIHSNDNKPLVRGKTSPYGFFVKMCYEEHKKKYPTENVQVTEISKKCSQKWKTMSEEEKKRFNELAQKDAERYQAEVAAYGGEDVLRKRKRAKKDPNAPKRALSAFFFFSNEKRPDIQQNHPDWKVGQIAQELGRFWKTLTEDDRQIYDKRALNDKERYAEEMRCYRIATGKQLPEMQLKQDDLCDDTEYGDQQSQSNQLPMQLLDEHGTV